MERVVEDVGKNHNVVKKWCNFFSLAMCFPSFLFFELGTYEIRISSFHKIYGFTAWK